MVNGSWPKKERQPFENIHEKEGVWTGLEYEPACDMINENLIEQALIMQRVIH
jgi:non-lysosomal glucosylceramidase